MVRIDGQPAFVLHDRPYRETSLLLEVLTRDHGRVGLVARGVRSARPRIPRGLLKPLVALELGWSGQGELGTLVAAEAVGPGLRLAGQALWAALYLNELLVRLLARNDPHPGIYERYAQCLAELEPGAELAWTLRRFERDVLAELGYGLELEVDAGSGRALVADAAYSYDPERGPVAWAARPLAPAVHGAALLALAGTRCPEPAVLAELRRMMRAVLRHHLGGRELNAWRLRAPSGAAPAGAEGGAD